MLSLDQVKISAEACQDLRLTENSTVERRLPQNTAQSPTDRDQERHLSFGRITSSRREENIWIQSNCGGILITHSQCHRKGLMRLNLSFFEELLSGSSQHTPKTEQPSTPPFGRKYKLSVAVSPKQSRNHKMSPPPRRTPSTLRIFESLYSELGYKNVKRWYLSHSNRSGLMEDQFLFFLRNLTDFHDYHILEIFDLLDTKDTGTVCFPNFFILVSLLAGLESGKSLHVLHRHGKKLFRILARPKGGETPATVDFRTFASLYSVLGITEDDILNSCRSLDLTSESTMDFDDFTLNSFLLMEMLDDLTERDRFDIDIRKMEVPAWVMVDDEPKLPPPEMDVRVPIVRTVPVPLPPRNVEEEGCSIS
ncbi:EF-hand calcium-binding domain-containing protein 9-like [Planoprotostelium fungivorum]|uniref:EF-hand calcium-binding domain-containing protein 9-like n=1 Tax=Planoprotostelium fungivorum TaxID=1890364 RepID=A0A2P6MM51_9EUKA|nr:EF-hand calcium-binding domain-containing protein 9-like [Planoprotostelium fungivorum]